MNTGASVARRQHATPPIRRRPRSTRWRWRRTPGGHAVRRSPLGPSPRLSVAGLRGSPVTQAVVHVQDHARASRPHAGARSRHRPPRPASTAESMNAEWDTTGRIPIRSYCCRSNRPVNIALSTIRHRYETRYSHVNCCSASVALNASVCTYARHVRRPPYDLPLPSS